jgi:hypothetical protein
VDVISGNTRDGTRQQLWPLLLLVWQVCVNDKEHLSNVAAYFIVGSGSPDTNIANMFTSFD